jgi:hypothetical protein
VSDHAHHLTAIPNPGPLKAPALKGVAIVLLVIGIATFGGLLLKDTERAWSAFLQGMLIPTFIGLGATFYIAVHSTANAKWNIPLRRIMEGLSSGIYLGAAAFLAIAIFGGSWLYDWFNLSGTDSHHNLFHVSPGSKASAMTSTGFMIVVGGIFVLWVFLRDKMVRMSIKQDATGENIRARHRKVSIAFLPAFAFGLTLFVWYMLLSLHVNWFSTMWGVYCFASAVQTFLCVTILFCLWIRRSRCKDLIQEHTMHDIATWMVGWSCFCAYIGFSQFMLIWYANLDEETYFYVMRFQHGWGTQYAIEALIRWPVVFLGLMSQSVRTKPWALTIVCIIALAGNWLDWNWIIQPAFSPNAYRSPFSLQELGVGAGFAGAFILLVLHFWNRHGIVPKGEPRLLATLNAEHLH